MSGMRNWAGNLTYHSTLVEAPSTVEELQSLVAGQRKIKALGTKHSFNDIADTDAVQISTENLNQVIEIDHKNSTVTVQGGIKYGDLAIALEKEKLALHNMASLPHISVAGGSATATHGSGLNNRVLPAAVVALDLVTADGSIKTFRKGQDDDFEGAVVNLGALGIVTNMTLKVEPTYKMTQWVYENLDLDSIEDHLIEVLGAGYSVSLFTRWQKAGFDQVWIKQLSDSQRSWDDFYGAKPAPENRHPIPGISAANCTMQLGVPGPWFERLPHFKMNFTPSNGDELQTEYLLPLQYAHEALTAISDMREQIAPLLQTSEIRTIASDDLWMSPSYQQPSLGIHFTWQPNWDEVKFLLPSIDEALKPFAPKPHWGKLFTMPSSEFLPRYEKLNDFLALRDRLDPNRKFTNSFLDKNL